MLYTPSQLKLCRQSLRVNSYLWYRYCSSQLNKVAMCKHSVCHKTPLHHHSVLHTFLTHPTMARRYADVGYVSNYKQHPMFRQIQNGSIMHAARKVPFVKL